MPMRDGQCLHTQKWLGTSMSSNLKGPTSYKEVGPRRLCSRKLMLVTSMDSKLRWWQRAFADDCEPTGSKSPLSLPEGFERWPIVSSTSNTNQWARSAGCLDNTL